MNVFPPRTLYIVLVASTVTGLARGQTTTLATVSSSGVQANKGTEYMTISSDGRIVAFDSFATNLVAGDTNGNMDVFVRDLATGVTERVSVDAAGNEASGESTQPALSADGRYVAFVSNASNLVPGDTNGVDDIFVLDRVTGSLERVSVDSAGNQSDDGSRVAMLSADGRIVAFFSSATNLVAADTNGVSDVFVHDRVTGVTERVSVDSTGAEGNGVSYAYFDGLSSDGSVVAFESLANNLVVGDGNQKRDVFVHERNSGVTTRVSVDSSGTEGNADSEDGSMSDDGRFVVFRSFASNLVGSDTNGSQDIFLHELATGITERCSVDSGSVESNRSSYGGNVSGDGRYVAFASDATNLDPNDSNKTWDVFVRDRALGTTALVSRSTQGVQGNDSSGNPFFSSDAQVLLFWSRSDNLVSGDVNGISDLFVRENCATDASSTNYGAGFPGTNGIPSLAAANDPVLGTTLAVDVGNSSGIFTFGLLVVGYQSATLHTSLGGDLLVLPAVTGLIGLSPFGAQLNNALPLDGTLCGLELDLQVLEADPGAAKGVSFTPGLELQLGQ